MEEAHGPLNSGSFYGLATVYIDGVPYSLPSAFPRQLYRIIMYRIIRWSYFWPELYTISPYDTIYCFTDTPDGKNEMIKWLRDLLERTPRDPEYERRREAINGILDLVMSTDVRDLPDPLDPDITEPPEGMTASTEKSGCSEVFTQKNPFALYPRLTTFPTAVKGVADFELFIPNHTYIPDLTTPTQSPNTSNPTSWLKINPDGSRLGIIRAARVYDGALMLFDNTSYRGRMLSLGGLINPPPNQSAEYGDLSPSCFDQKAQSIQQV
jgi:hypothetical protein